MIDRITVPKDVHLLILEACEYSGLHGKRNFEDVIKVKDFRWKFILDYPDRSYLIIWVLKSEENSPAAENQRDNNLRKTQQDLWRWRRETKSQEMWVTPRCWKRQGSRIFPGVLWKECRLGETLILAQWEPCCSSDMQNCKIINICMLSHYIHGNLLWEKKKTNIQRSQRRVALTPFQKYSQSSHSVSFIQTLSFFFMEIRLLCPKVYPEKNSEIHFCVTPERTECQIELVMKFTTNNWSSQVKSISGESPKMKSLALVLRTQLDLVFLFFHRDLSFYAFPLLCSYFSNLLEFPAALFPIVILSKT